MIDILFAFTNWLGGLAILAIVAVSIWLTNKLLDKKIQSATGAELPRGCLGIVLFTCMIAFILWAIVMSLMVPYYFGKAFFGLGF